MATHSGQWWLLYTVAGHGGGKGGEGGRQKTGSLMAYSWGLGSEERRVKTKGQYCEQFWLGLPTWVHWWPSGGDDGERDHNEERRRQGWYCRQFWLGLLTWVHWWPSGGDDGERDHNEERRRKTRMVLQTVLVRVTDLGSLMAFRWWWWWWSWEGPWWWEEREGKRRTVLWTVLVRVTDSGHWWPSGGDGSEAGEGGGGGGKVMREGW